MRMWNVPTNLLCRRPLLGEHVEIHMMIGVLKRSKSIRGFVETGLYDLRLIETRHEQIVQEMTKRGMNHKSPLITDGVIIPRIGYVDVEGNLKELRKRCPECKKLQEKNLTNIT